MSKLTAQVYELLATARRMHRACARRDTRRSPNPGRGC